MGKTDGIPFGHRARVFVLASIGQRQKLLMPPEKDMFR